VVSGELLVVESEVASAITAQVSSGELSAAARNAGAVSLAEDALMFVAEGITSLEEIARAGV
jgi:type II secretory ATPase GspE/PulE/Tfp pilus assembly ATPase PilB-like protein